ncbi:MAG TPA: S8 family serine peptidase [Candidatus Polarisedimenticolia bacterium]|nr:S8 family serine peptidase [Candidatus Polarisedimenticolia bacterium]
MRRSTNFTRLSLVVLGLAVFSVFPARTEKKKPGLDSMLHRMIKASEKAARQHGRPDAIEPDEMAFYKRTVVAGTYDGVPSVRVRMQVDPSTRQTIEQMGIKTYGRMNGFASAVVPIARLDEISNLPGVVRMQAQRVMQKELDVSRVETRSRDVELNFGSRGRGVIVGSIDTGVDWRNDDFRNPDGTTRIKYIWSQDDACVGTPPAPPFDYGCLYTEAQINAALTGGPTITAPDADGHGTHTLGISSGNGRATGSGQPANVYVGMAPEADIIVVKTFPEPTDTTSCPNCFSLSDGLEFIDAMAASLGKPYSINMSLGSQFGGHDGSDLDELTIDSLIGTGIPGQVIVKSAGNERGHAIHIGGVVAAGGTNTHSFVIPSYVPVAGTFNDAIAWQLYYNNGDNLTVTIADPPAAPCGNTTLTLSQTTGGGAISSNTTSGAMVIDDSSSPGPFGQRFFDMEVDDQFGSAPCRGTWQLRVRGNTITAGGRYDAWIWFSSFGGSQAEALWSVLDDTRNISVPGTAFDVTTVGAYYTKTSWLSTDNNTYQFNFTPPAVLGALAAFSSAGPSRDGRIKPEIMAPGSAIVSTLSADAAPTIDVALIVPDDHHWALPGTSMSAPHITGIYAQMLALNPNLDAIELRNLATGTARVDGNVPLPVPNSNWGYGKVDALAMATRAVQNIPDLVPSGATGSFSWTALPTATTYNLYRGDLSLNGPGYYGSCLAPGLPTPNFSDSAIPVEGGGFFYLVTGVWNGVEGSLGKASDGTPRVNSSPCP